MKLIAIIGPWYRAVHAGRCRIFYPPARFSIDFHGKDPIWNHALDMNCVSAEACSKSYITNIDDTDMRHKTYIRDKQIHNMAFPSIKLKYVHKSKV